MTLALAGVELAALLQVLTAALVLSDATTLEAYRFWAVGAGADLRAGRCNSATTLRAGWGFGETLGVRGNRARSTLTLIAGFGETEHARPSP